MFSAVSDEDPDNQYSSDQGEGVFYSDEAPFFSMKSYKILKELLIILKTAVPLSSCLTLACFPNVLNLYFFAKTGDLQGLCIIGGVFVFFNVFYTHFLASFNAEICKNIKELNEQPHFSFRAAYNKYTIGLYFHRGLVFGTVLLFLMGIVVFFLGVFLGDQTFYDRIQRYLLILLPSVYFNFAFDLTNSLLFSLNVINIPTTFLILTVFLHYLFCVLFELEGNFSLNIAGICKNITDFLNTFLLMLYAWNLKSLAKIWIPWTSASFKDLFSHIDFSAVFIHFIEFLAYEFPNIAVFFFANIKELAPFLIISCVQSLNLAIDRGFSRTFAVVLDKSVKENAVNKVKNRAFFAIFLVFLLVSTQWLCFFLIKTVAEQKMLRDELAKRRFQEFCEFYAYKIFLDGFFMSFCGILKGLQKFHACFYANLLFFLGNCAIFLVKLGGDEENDVDFLWKSTVFSELGCILFVILYLCVVINWKREINEFCLNKLRKNLDKT